MKSGRLIPTLLLAGCFCAALSTGASATDKTDIMVGMKTLPVLTNKITGSATMAVVYDAANAESKTDADAIKAAVDGGLDVPGGITLKAELVSTSELTKLSNAKIAFLARGIPVAAFDSIASAATTSSVLTISTDLDCVKANKCVLGVVSKPSVEIYYSKAASDSAKISFVQAFTMLAKQI